MRQHYIPGVIINTIYFGGGTPSLLRPNLIKQILDSLLTRFSVSRLPEITLEANPEDITPQRIKEYCEMGINRLSLGVQSFHDADLNLLNRSHTGKQAMNAVRLMKHSGFTNFSIDLLYGIPGQTLKRWRKILESAVGLNIPHISAYALTVEKGTALDLLVRKGKFPSPDEDLSLEHFLLLTDFLNDNGYIHYEISNFCLPGFESVHNSNYWKGIMYMGLGPSAHSFNGQSRQWNISNLTEYLKAMKDHSPCWEKEVITPVSKFNELVMLSLRTRWGCDLAVVEEQFGTQCTSHLKQQSLPYIQEGMMRESENKLVLTRKGMFLSDSIIADLFLEDK